LTWSSPSNLLTEDQSEDFKLFMHQLPELVAGLRHAGLLKANEGDEKSVDPPETNAVKIPKSVDGVNMTNGPLLANFSPGGRPQSSSANLTKDLNRESASVNTDANIKSTHFQESGITEAHETRPDRPPSLQDPGNATQNHIPTPQVLQTLG
jgi:hypothetical protein